MSEIERILPQKLQEDSRYSVRVRTVNSFGKESDWSESLVIDTSALPTVSGNNRLQITDDSIYAYDADGQLAFGYFGKMGNRVNLVANPSLGINATGWEAGLYTLISRDTSQYCFGSEGHKASLKLTALESNRISIKTSSSHFMTVEQGKRYTASCYAKVGFSSFPVNLILKIEFYSADNKLISVATPATPTLIGDEDGWIRFHNISRLAPPQATKAKILIETTSSILENSYIYLDGFLFERSDRLDEYFDGTTSNFSAWQNPAAPHNSPSTQVNGSGALFLRGHLQMESFTSGKDNLSFRGDKDGNIWSGHVDINSAPFKVLNTGALSATSGFIGGFQIGATSLTAGTGSNSIGISSSGTAFYAGNGTPTSAPFRVTSSGQLTATNASINGNITASGGSIGGYTIGLSSLTAHNVGVSTGTTTFWAGSNTATSAPFRVTSGGQLTATNAILTGTFTSGLIQTKPEGQFPRIAIGIDVGNGAEAEFWGTSGAKATIRNFGTTVGNADLRLVPGGTVYSFREDAWTFNRGGVISGDLSVGGDLSVSGTITGSFGGNIEAGQITSGTLSRGVSTAFAVSGGSVSSNGGDMTCAAPGVLRANGNFMFPDLGSARTTSATTPFVVVTSSGFLFRNTSLRKFKDNIVTLSSDDANIVDLLRPVSYTSLCEADDPHRKRYGLIAEEVEQIDPSLAGYDEDGSLNGVDYVATIPLLIAKVKQLSARVAVLEGE